MALSLQYLLEAPVIELDIIDSTNNYAMRLLDADTAQAGLTILAQAQTHGKGQRGRIWDDTSGQSILMSIVLMPEHPLDKQFLFSASVAVAIADVLANLYEHWDVRIKWPNDIIVNDKKTGGVLIENILRGNVWANSIVGLGLNVLQTHFSEKLPKATSLKMLSSKEFDVKNLALRLRNKIVEYSMTINQDILDRYNEYLYKKSKPQIFWDGENEWSAVIVKAMENGMLKVQLENGKIVNYVHGEVLWKW